MPNYKIISDFYDTLDVVYFRNKQRSPRTAMLDMIPNNPVRVLDVCAGTCSNSVLIAQNRPQAKVTALDLSAEMLSVAEQKFHKHGITNIETIVADARDTWLAANSFDVIIMSLVLHEIDERPRMAIFEEVKRLLSDEGVIIVVEWEQPIKLFQRFVFTPIKQFEPAGFMAFLRLDLTSYFENAGFMVLEKQSCDYTQVYKLSK